MSVIFSQKRRKKIEFFMIIHLTATKHRFILYVKEFGYMIVRMIIETIRRHIKSCGKTKTRYRIAKETGVGEDQLCRIMQGKTCTLETAEKLLEYFGLTIAKRQRKTKKGGGPRK